jgi:hypothetical protein
VELSSVHYMWQFARVACHVLVGTLVHLVKELFLRYLKFILGVMVTIFDIISGERRLELTSASIFI